MILWQPAQVGWLIWAPRRARAVWKAGFLVSWTRAKFTLPGGSGTFWHRNISRSALPRMVGELRPGWECSATKLAWDNKPERGSPSGYSCGTQTSGEPFGA